MTLQDLLNLKKIALQNRVDEGFEYFIERCYRYYSKTYHTPLHIAKQILSDHEAYMIYLEDSLEDSAIEEVKAELDDFEKDIKPVFQGGSEKQASEISDDEWIAQQEMLLKQQEQDKQKKQIMEETSKSLAELEKQLASFKTSISRLPEEGE